MLWSTEQNKKMEEVSMNSTALGAEKEKILTLLVKHMRNSTMKKFRKLEKQMYITRHFAIALE